MAVSLLSSTNYGDSRNTSFSSACCKHVSLGLSAGRLAENSFNLSALTISLSHRPADSMVVHLHTLCGAAGTVTLGSNQLVFYSNADSLIVSVDLISLLPGNCTIAAVVVGTSEAEFSVVYLTSMLVIVYSTTAPPPAPVLTGAAFANNAATVVVSFDSETNRGGTEDSFDCKDVLVFPGCESSRCQWFGLQAITIFPSNLVVPGVNISLLNDTIASKCVAGTTALCVEFPRSVATTVVLTMPQFPIAPTVIITGPERIGSCSNLTIDITNSIGSAGRPWMSPEFTIQTEPLGVEVGGLVHFLDNEFEISPPSPIVADLLVPDTAYTITVTMCNFLGYCGIASTHVLVEPSESVPVVTILGPPERDVLLKNSFSIAAKALVTTCQNGTTTSPNFIYSWRVALYDLYGRPDIESESVSPGTFLLSPFILEAGKWYSFELRVTDSLTASTASAVAVVNVLRGQLVPIVAGGSERTARLGESLLLDGSGSYDQDQLGVFGSGLDTVDYSWSCIGLQPVYSSACPVVLSPPGGESTTVSNMTHLNATSRVTLTMSDATRVAVAYIDITTIEAAAPEMFVVNVASPVARSVELKLSATIMSSIECQSRWSYSDTDIPLENVTLSPVVVTSAAHSTLPVFLLIAANSLTDGQSYRFTLQCRDAFASIEIGVNAAPRYGSLSVTPPSGIELSTRFEFVTRNWYDSEVPLSFQFEFISYSQLNMTISNRVEQSFAVGVLPAGNPDAAYNLTCLVRVFDSLDASAVAFDHVAVAVADTDIVPILSDGLVNSAASGDVDATKQLLSVGASVINQINMSESVDCAALHRAPTLSLGRSCGQCVSGYVGENPPSSVECRLPSGPVVQKTCSGVCFGNCTLIDINSLDTLTSCSTNDTSCTAVCMCSVGFFGFENECAPELSELDKDIAIRESLMSGLDSLTVSEDANSQSIIGWVEMLRALAQRSDPLSPTITRNGLGTALTAILAAQEKHSHPNAVVGLLHAVDTLTTVAATTYHGHQDQAKQNRQMQKSQKTSLRKDHNFETKETHRLLQDAVTSDSAEELRFAHNATRAVLATFGDMQLSSMVPLQQPFIALQRAFKMTAQITNTYENTSLLLQIPQSPDEHAYGASAATVNLTFSGRPTRVSTALLETKVAQFGEAAVNFTANPITVVLGGDDAINSTVQIKLPHIRSVQFVSTNTSSADNVTTVCAAGDAGAYWHECPGGVEIMHECNSTAGTHSTLCPPNRVVPLCRLLDGFGSCSIISQNSQESICECTVSFAKGVRSVEIVSMSDHQVNEIATTFAVLDDGSSAEEVLKGSIIVVIIFSSIWGIGLISLLASHVWQKPSSPAQSAVSVVPFGIEVDVDVQGNPKIAAEPTSVLDIAMSDAHVLQLYVRNLLPAIYEAQVPLGVRITDVLKRRHQYLGILFPSNSSSRVEEETLPVIIFRILTLVTVILTIIAVAYDLESPNDDGTCEPHETLSACLERTSVFDGSKSYCEWKSSTADPNTGQCTYAEPSFGWKETAYGAILVSITMVFLSVPVDHLFQILTAPTVESLARELEGNSLMRTAAQTTGIIQHSSRKVVPATPMSSDPSPAPSPNRKAKLRKLSSTFTFQHARESGTARGDLWDVKHSVRESSRLILRQDLLHRHKAEVAKLSTSDVSKDIEASTTVPVQALLERVMLQMHQLNDSKAPGALMELARFKAEWCYDQLCAPGSLAPAAISAVENELQRVAAASSEKARTLREMRGEYAQIGVEIMIEFFFDAIGRDTKAAKIFEEIIRSEHNSVGIESNMKKGVAFCFIVIINLACITFVVLKAWLRGLAWQRQYLVACVLQLLVEVLLFETLVILWEEVLVPQLAFDEVCAAYDDVMHTIDALRDDCVSDEITPGDDTASSKRGDVDVLNAADYLFVSARLAVVFDKHVESTIVARYESIHPSKSLALLLRPDREKKHHSAGTWSAVWDCLSVTFVAAYLSAMVLSVAVTPMWIQKLVLNIMQPLILAAVCVLMYECVRHPLLLAAVVVSLFTLGWFLKRYINGVSGRQRGMVKKVSPFTPAAESSECTTVAANG